VDSVRCACKPYGVAATATIGVGTAAQAIEIGRCIPRGGNSAARMLQIGSYFFVTL
jgi:hypothetical protein